MRYPSLGNSKCAELAAQLVSGEDPAIDPHARWVGEGDEIDIQSVAEVAREIIHGAGEWTDTDRDRFEGKASVKLLTCLEHVPTEVVDDRGFWRFLSLRYFWEFIAWREAEAFSKGNYLKYVDAARSTEAVLPRMYLRARAVGGREHADLASAVPKGADFWRSHVLRVRTGSAPPLTRAFISKQADARLPTGRLRAAARRINRSWANVVLDLYGDEEARSLIDRVWESDSDV